MSGFSTSSAQALPTFLITTLAEYQTCFWSAVGQELERRSIPVAFLSFDDRSTAILREAGLTTFALEVTDVPEDLSDATLDDALGRFGIEDFPFWSSHERFTFGIKEEALRRKFLEYLSLADRVCTQLTDGGRRAVLVQELGGFLSVVATYHAARVAQMDNWFIEPAFFRGRLFFLKNSFSAPQVSELFDGPVSQEVLHYLAATVASGSIVVPKKDIHQYTTAFRKIVNRKNVVRLFQKLVDKHVLGKRQEFGYIGRHVRVHASMLFNSLRLRGHYTRLEDAGPIVYYPLHVPADMALTLRSPQYLDQLALVDIILRSVPHTHRVAIKEHPAMIGALDVVRLLELKRRYDNLLILPPSTNNYQVIRAADMLVSINSKSGAEAALLGKQVLVLGDAFYRHSPLVRAIDDPAQLRPAIREMLAAPNGTVASDQTCRYFEAVWRGCLPGELYVTDDESLQVFVDSMLTGITV